MAIIFELGKFYVWYSEYGECKATADLGGAFWSLLFYGVLAAISIGGVSAASTAPPTPS